MSAAVDYRASVMKVPPGVLMSKNARTGLTIAACLLGSSLASASSASATAPSASSVRQTLERSLDAAKGAGSARITVNFFSGSTTGKVVQDSSADSGEQTVAIGKELASVVLVGGVAYISGNRQGMTSYFGLPANLAPTLAGRWISVPHSDPAFRAITANVTLASALDNVTPGRPLTMGKRSTVNGQSVKSIAGAAPGGGGRLVLFFAAHGRSLPVEAAESSRGGTSAKGEIVTFTRWGESLHVATPQGAIPISALEAASSASG
jgi:hypothetical protein